MKTRTYLRTSFLPLLVALTLFSCKKSGSSGAGGNSLSALSGNWHTTAWGGVNNNILTFSINAGTATGTVTGVGTQPKGFAVGDQLLTAIVYNSPGRYNATGKFTYGPQNDSSGTRAAILTLQNNNTQLTIDYVAINSNFPEIIYVFQAGQLTAMNRKSPFLCQMMGLTDLVQSLSGIDFPKI